MKMHLKHKFLWLSLFSLSLFFLIQPHEGQAGHVFWHKYVEKNQCGKWRFGDGYAENDCVRCPNFRSGFNFTTDACLSYCECRGGVSNINRHFDSCVAYCDDRRSFEWSENCGDHECCIKGCIREGGNSSECHRLCLQ